MNKSFEEIEKELNKRFEETKNKAIQVETILNTLKEEILKIQGEFRLLQQLKANTEGINDEKTNK